MKNDPMDIIFPKINPIQAWLMVALIPWTVLIISWLFFVVSITISFEVPASGAVLVCGALISEIFYFKQRWTKLNTDPSGSFNLIPTVTTKEPLINGQFINAPAGSGKLGALLSLAKNYEVKVNETTATWFYTSTVSRIEIVVLSAIVVTAVAGTALWGYGHLYF